VDTQLTTRTGFDLVPIGADKDTRYRLGLFRAWLASDQERRWYKPDLAAYAGDLLGRGYAPETVKAHLSTVRGQYRRMMITEAIRDALYELATSQVPGHGPADRKALVDEALTRLENAIDPKAAPVKATTHQDRPDAAHLRLTADQANALLAAPGVDTLQGLRDTAAISLLLCTGIREAELSALQVGDLRQRLSGELALHVRHGKGDKARLVPYGDLPWVLAIVDKWLAAAAIDAGPVLRGFWKGTDATALRPGRLCVRAIQDILASYPIMVDGRLVTARPHDLRRTYARRLYEAGVDPVAIQQNLGHASLKTTLGYIGPLDAARRRPPAIYSFDLARLAKVPIQRRLQGTASGAVGV
jgi:integrase